MTSAPDLPAMLSKPSAIIRVSQYFGAGDCISGPMSSFATRGGLVRVAALIIAPSGDSGESTSGATTIVPQP
ncbi:hypothetical protein GCM10027058_08320 [Microbacterium neimengense]